MPDDRQRPKLTRRELLERAGLAGIAVVATATLPPIVARAAGASGDDGAIESFLAAAYSTRADAMTTGDTSKLANIYDPASSALLAFEQERAAYFHSGLGSRLDA